MLDFINEATAEAPYLSIFLLSLFTVLSLRTLLRFNK